MKELAQKAKKASIKLGAINGELKNKALYEIANEMDRFKAQIIEANKEDVENAIKNKIDESLIDRLVFDEKKIDESIEGIKELIKLENPVGQVQLARELTQGLNMYRVSSPIGLVGVIFESRPDALIQIATLCLKSGNAVLLKGGSEALNTNRILYEIIDVSGQKAGLPKGWINLLETRDDVRHMLSQDEHIDLIIPRGSNDFVRYIMENSLIPVLGHSDGICHIYIDKDYDVSIANKVVVDAKTQAVAVCNAVETLLIHEEILSEILPTLTKNLKEKGVELRGDEKIRQVAPMKEASELDWETEYLEKILAIKAVSSIEDAIDHINFYGSGHTDGIITQNKEAALLFMNYVDSAGVYHNCSTRFADGYRYGFGAEVGISTGKIHARGPMGLEGLCTYKYRLFGDGNIVGEMGEDKKQYTFKTILSKDDNPWSNSKF